MVLALQGYAHMGHTTAADPFELLFLAQYARVVTIAYSIVADADEAEDVAQDVFMSFHRGHAADAPYAAAWLHRAAVHEALNHVRGKRRRGRREAADMCDRERLDAGAEQALDPQRALEADELRREVRAALGRLPIRNAAILALRYSGLSYAEVAATLGVRTNAVGTLLRRAEDAMRKELEHATSR